MSDSDQDQLNSECTSGAGCIMRLYWTLLGNGALALVFATLLLKHPKLPSLVDVACFLLVLSLVCVRYIDIRYYKGETGDGKLATLTDWRRYSVLIVLGNVCLWLVIRILVPLFAK
jgi:hypothetical protein